MLMFMFYLEHRILLLLILGFVIELVFRLKGSFFRGLCNRSDRILLEWRNISVIDSCWLWQ
jgi:hypothetical protein